MKYTELVEIVAELSGKPVEEVKDIFFALPVALCVLQENESVKTPLGVFRAFRRAGWKVPMPDGSGVATVESQIVVKLRPGVRLRKD